MYADGLRYCTTADGKGSVEGRARSVTTRSNLPTREAIALSAAIYIYMFCVIYTYRYNVIIWPALENPSGQQQSNYTTILYVYLLHNIRGKENNRSIKKK